MFLQAAAKFQSIATEVAPTTENSIASRGTRTTGIPTAVRTRE
jgi:hypothetical protein